MIAGNKQNLDSLFEEAALLVFVHQWGSSSLLQRKLHIGYVRAGKIMDQLQSAGVVEPFRGSEPRKIRFTQLTAIEKFLSVYLTSGNKPARKLLNGKTHQEKVIVETFKNIVDLIIPDEKHREAYQAALDNLIILDDLYSDFFRLMCRLYLSPLSVSEDWDNSWPFFKVRIAGMSQENIKLLLDKRKSFGSEELTLKGNGFHLHYSRYLAFRMTYQQHSTAGVVEKDKWSDLKFNCNTVRIELKEITVNG